MDFFSKSIHWIRYKLLDMGLFLVSLIFITYLLCEKFRIFLKTNEIDPNFIIGFLTVIALLLSFKQSSNDKRYSYNLRLIDSIEDKGLKIVGKLLGIRGRSWESLSSATHCIDAKNKGILFKDLNNISSKEKIETELELITAYVDTYFPEQKNRWNSTLDKLSEISNISNNILINYQENIDILYQTNFRNEILDNADNYLEQARKIDTDIDTITFEIREGIVEKMNNYTKKVKNTI